MSHILGIDIGGTKTEVAILKTPEGMGANLTIGKLIAWANQGGTPEIIFRERMKTLRLEGYDQLVRRLVELVQTAILSQGLTIADISSIGIGMPGPVDPNTNKMVAGNSAIFIGREIGKDVGIQLGFDGPVVCGNDGNCFVLAESCIGRAKTFTGRNFHATVVGIVLGTGVGGGVFGDHRIWAGRRGGAGEFGHMTLFEGGHPCYCGQLGCAEQYLSGPALEAAFTRRIYAQIQSRPTANQIFELAEQYDPIAMAIVKRFKKHLAHFLSMLTQAFDPHAIVIGGGLSKQLEIYRAIEDVMTNYLFLANDGPPVLQNQLGDSAGVVGAAFLPILVWDDERSCN